MRDNEFGRRRLLGLLGAAGVGVAVTTGTTRPGTAGAATGTRAFLGSYTSSGAGGSGIGVAAVDPRTGRLTVETVVDVADPSFLAMSPDRRYLYAVNEGSGAGTATAVDVRSSRPTVLNTVAVQGEGPTHLCVTPDGRYVLTANYTSGSVSVLAVADGGRLGAVTDVVQHTGTGPDPDRQSAPHAHQVSIDPSGRWVLVVDLGVDSIYVYRLADGKLHRHAQAAMTPGSGPRHLAFHPNGRTVFLANELNSTVTVCEWQAERGELRAGLSLPADLNGGGDRNYPSAPVVAKDGRFLYLANRGHDNVATFAVLGGGFLAPLGTTPCGGKFPRDLTLSPDGRRLYAANQKSNSVTCLNLDPFTGLPAAPSASFEVPAATCVLFE
ncbi:lactonase family protein [Nocardia iowensis]|uniref:Lactonase family protein n=1 Tax=Nocardia iowensis TaxID=204891 RepID=A0ABX8RK93_NOCIO|nr:lactonase family protein [Nocardia iowensis]QXN90063.1 lactonase family protein [Nocardia iowensis]